MDLTDILRKRTEGDLRIAIARTLEISLEIEAATAELKELRTKLRALERRANARKPQETGVFPVADRPGVSFRPSVPLLFGKLLRPRRRPSPIRWHLDEIAGILPLRDKNGVKAVVSRTGQPALTISGWVVPIEGQPAFVSATIELVGGGRRISREVKTHPRADVAAHFANPDYVSCGLRLDIPMFDIPAGFYTLEISARTLEGRQAAVRAGAIEVSA